MRVIISGYYGFHNAGDEAVLAGLIAGLVAQPPPAVSGSGNSMDITVFSGDPAATANLHGVRAVGRGLGAFGHELRDADLLISGGGSLFQDATSARSCLYYLYVIRQALRARVPVAVLGQGIGPLRRWWVRALVRRCLNRVQGIALRDSESARELERLGINRPPIRVGADLSFAMSLPAAEEVAAAWRGIGVDDASAVLAVAPRLWRIGGVGEELVARLAAAINQSVAGIEPRPHIAVFPMQRPQDDPACAALADAVGGIFARADLPPGMVAGMIGSARVVVGMRLHALIFAAMGGAMPVAISYDPKIEAFMADLGLSVAATAAGLAGRGVEVSESQSSHPSPWQGEELPEARLPEAIIAAWNAGEDPRAALRQAAEERRQGVADVFTWAVEFASKPQT